MGSEASRVRLVRCPKCRQLLTECADVPVYKCGGCGTTLQAKARHVNNVEIGHKGSHPAVLCESPPCSNSGDNPHEEESNCSEVEESSACRENPDMEVGSTSDLPNSAGQPALVGEDTISVPSALQLQPDGSCKLSQHGSVNSSSESVVSEEEVFDGNSGNRQIHNLGTSVARSSHAYDSSVSSGDDISSKHQKYRLLSRRTFRNRNPSEPSSTGTKDVIENSSRKAAHASDRDAFPASGNLYPVENELEVGHLSSLSRSPSRDSTSLEDFPCSTPGGAPSSRSGNLQSDRMEQSRRVDLPRDQPTRPYSGGRIGDWRGPVGGTRHDGHRPLFSDLWSAQVPTPFCNGDMSQWPSRVAQQYQSSGMPLSGQASGSCLHHHHAELTPAQLPLSIHCRGCSSHMCFRPSAAASSGCPQDVDVALRHDSDTSDHNLRKLPCKEKWQHRKRRHCRPVSHGAPFVVCSSCFELLQLPVDFLLSTRRRHKLRCGACSKVLTFLYHGGHVVPDTSAQLDPSSGEVNKNKQELSVNSHGSVEEDPVSYSEEYGPPPSQSYSTDGEPVATILRTLPEQKGNGRYKQTMGPALHHLMGYASARDLIFVPSVEDESYDNMDMSLFYRTSDDIDFVAGYGRNGTSSTLRGHSEIEEEEPVMRFAGARGGPPPHRGYIREQVAEVNHGLENMKLKSHKNGRPW